MRSLSTGKLSSLYSLPKCMVFERVRSINKKRIREGKHFRMVTGRNGTVFFVFFFAMGRSHQAFLRMIAGGVVVCGLENSIEMTDGTDPAGGLVVGRCPMEGQILRLNSLEREHDSQ